MEMMRTLLTPLMCGTIWSSQSVILDVNMTGLLTLCKVKSQFSSMKAWYRTVKRGTCHALTGGGEG